MTVIRSIKIPLAVLVFCLLTQFLVRPPLLAIGIKLHQDSDGGPHLLNLGTDLAQLVNVFVGTGARVALPAAYSGGETFPGADTPFGMVQWSPDTVHRAFGGYDYHDSRIRGFGLTHISGAGCHAYGDLPFMPFTDAITTSPATDPTRYISTYSHANELAYAGYYQVRLDNSVLVELTATQRSGAARFTYPAGQPASMLIDLAGAFGIVTAAQATIGSDTISGWVSSGNFCGTHRNTYRLYFWAQFSQPFASSGVWKDGSVVRDATTVTGPRSGVFVTFDTSKQNVIGVRAGLSYVSVDNAKANVNQENPRGDFDAVYQQAVQTWNQRLGVIQIRGGTEAQRETFYTALYHTQLFPSIFSDVNGQYIGFDGQVHTVPAGHAQYANFSGWDIYRSEAQLLALLAPAQASDMAQSLVNDYLQGGILPKWPIANAETYVMVGDPADAILADIYAFGGTNFDVRAALTAMVTQATRPNSERPGLSYLQTLGYIPPGGNYGCCNFYGSAATSLEYNTADFAISALARALGESQTASQFQQRAQNWRRLFNPATGYLQARLSDGSFPTNFSPASGAGWTEGNNAQYSWMVPFNLRGLFDAMGGNANVIQRLDTFFTDLNAGINQPYAYMGNEPTIETPWEYDYAGAPYKTQHVVREVVNTLYTPDPNGLPGNDDLGELSSWYVFAALGMYPETPGTANLVLASPLFPHITIHRPNGVTIRINAPGASADVYYVQRLLVNGQPGTRPWLPPSFVAQGGTLDYTLASTPNPSWGADPADAPPSYQ